MKPIPLKLLPSTVAYQKYLGNTGEKVSFASSLNLTHVKIEERKIYRKSLDRVEVVGNAMLFYDCFHSSGLNDIPIPQSKITYNGKEYIVVDTDVLRGYSDTPHHYEVLLK